MDRVGPSSRTSRVFLCLNAAQCLRCFEVLRSQDPGVTLVCSCGGLSISGGSFARLRRAESGVDFVDLSEPAEKPPDKPPDG